MNNTRYKIMLIYFWPGNEAKNGIAVIDASISFDSGEDLDK